MVKKRSILLAWSKHFWIIKELNDKRDPVHIYRHVLDHIINIISLKEVKPEQMSLYSEVALQNDPFD